MACGINVIAVFVACASLASAEFTPFPHGKVTTYNYRTTVKTTTNDESPYASQFLLQGKLHVTHDLRDPGLTNAYHVALSDVVTDMHNGETVDYDGKPVVNTQSIDSNAGIIEQPFLLAYREDGTLRSVEIGDNEPEWSKNMKMAMASMLQLDFPNINFEKVANEHVTFTTQEKTIYGDCSVTYNVDPMDGPEEFRVNKTFSPIDCDGFAVQEFNNVDNDHCKAKKPEHMSTDSSRDVEITKQGEGILMKKLVAYSAIRVLSANGASYPHYVITNTTLELLDSKEKTDEDLQHGDFMASERIYDWTYRKPQTSYVPNAAVDVTQGRRVVNGASLSSHLDKLLSDAFNYIEENHFSPSEMNWDHAQTINKIFDTMKYMDADQLQAAFDKYENSVHRRDIEIKNIFLGVVAQVGTPASCYFTRNIIVKNKISTMIAIQMLTKLPLNVKVPTMELLAQMEILMKLDAKMNKEVRKAGILSFSSLIYRTFKNLPNPDNDPIFHKYIQDFFNGLKYATTYEMKLVYLMGIKNMQVEKIYDLLEPFITGNQDITPDPDRFQLLAMWAMDKDVEGDYPSAIRILWPVMSNKTLSTKLRIAAYEILMNQAPDDKSARNLHEYVSTEGNEHFYNYHYTTLNSIAQSADQCKRHLRTIVTSILNETPYPRDSAKNIHHPLSGVHTVSYVAQSFIYGEKVDISKVVNELTGDLEVLKLEHQSVDNDGSVSDLSIQLHIEGLDDAIRLLRPRYYPRMKATKILEILQKANGSVPELKDTKIDIVLKRSGRVFMASHYDYESFSEMIDNLMEYYYYMTGTTTFNYQNVVFDRLYEKQMTSDIGVPITVETRIPVVTSVQLNHTNIIHSMNGLDLDIEFKTWIHGDYSMSVYNPMKDAWHAVRSSTVSEINLPFHAQLIPGPYPDIMKIRFRERPGAAPSVAGILIRGKHLVTVDEEGSKKLKESCNTCLSQEDVHDGSRRVDDSGEYKERNFDSKSLGLKGSSYIYRSEYGYLSEMYAGYVANWDETFMSKIPSSWTDVLVESPMDVRYWWKFISYDVQQAIGGCILRIEPSSNYSFSEINVNLRGKFEDYDKNQTNLERSHAFAFRVSLTFDPISSLTNTTVGSWEIDLDVDANQGHLSNKGSLQLTRKIPGEQNYKICIDANKNYPIPPGDELKIGETKEEIDTKMSLTYGYTDSEECNRNQSLLSVTVKAQLSDEQKMQSKDDLENSACSKDTKNPLYSSSKNLVPRTINCLNEAIRYTTPRKYTVDVTHKELSPGFTSFMYRSLTDDMEPSERGTFQFTAEFPMTTNAIDFHYMTNTSDITKVTFPMKDLRRDHKGPVMKPFWDFPLDNSRYELQSLWKYISDDIRFCSVYPGIVDRGDAGKLPFTIPSDEWILLSGDHYDNRFAIFAKQPRPNYLSFQVFIKDQKIQFLTRESDNKLVAIGDHIEAETGVRLPDPDNLVNRLPITRANDHFVVRMGLVPATLRIGSNYITIAHDSELQGHVSGLCGHLNGSPFSSQSDIYSTKDID